MQAVLITAHKNMQQIIELSKKLVNNFEVYIHFDTKMIVNKGDLETLNNLGVHHYQRYNVNWGGPGILKAQRWLLKESLKNPDITYMHLISGQCWPCINPTKIYEYYEGKNDLFIESSPAVGTVKSREPLVLWQKYYFNYDKINRRTLYGKLFHRASLLKQTLFHVNKLKDLNISLELFQGPNWMDLPRDAVSYLLDYYEKSKDLQRVFNTGFCSDEFWVQTILTNSEFASRFNNNIHRYIKWEKQHDSYPAILDDRNYDEVSSGDYHFMRKIDLEISHSLLEKLNVL